MNKLLIILLLLSNNLFSQQIQVSSINYKNGAVVTETIGFGSPVSSCTGLLRYNQLDALLGENIWECINGLMVQQGGGRVAVTSNVLKGNGSGEAVAAIPGTDYVIPSGSISGNSATSTLAATATHSLNLATDFSTQSAANPQNGTFNSISLITPLSPSMGGTGVSNPTGYAFGNGNGNFTFSSTIPNSSLLNSSLTINNTLMSLGGNYTISSAPSGSAGGDLSGTYPNPTVLGLNGLAVIPNITVVGTNSLGQLVSRAVSGTSGSVVLSSNPIFTGTMSTSGNISAGGQLLSEGNVVTNGNVVMQELNLATSTANFNSNFLQITGSYWTGTTAGSDIWSANVLLGNGANPTSTLNISHAGTSGPLLVNIPYNINTGILNSSGYVGASTLVGTTLVSVSPFGSNSGSGPSAGCVAGYHCSLSSGTVYEQTGSGTPTQLAIQISSSSTLPNILNCSITQISLNLSPYIINATTSSFQIQTATQSLAASTIYQFSYVCGD